MPLNPLDAVSLPQVRQLPIEHKLCELPLDVDLGSKTMADSLDHIGGGDPPLGK